MKIRVEKGNHWSRITYSKYIPVERHFRGTRAKSQNSVVVCVPDPHRRCFSVGIPLTEWQETAYFSAPAAH